ncbi:class I adenylate-forming enzyme family protein [Modestobacter sp. Leaf380]|uniref:class I adenylate-forming enzyme family protein n=1 Tax=Modestobacter sp. Leaf380 TaxID=1736356 RepID=UPI0006F2C856|nr:AMP-binding protein [Modestobacter sp. Leaf380]KQS68634.1 acyl-CoA synthetase [Modestobacter sp. Leaf380]
MSVYTDKPWLALYGEGQPASITPEHDTLLAVFQATVAGTPDAVAIRYFDGTLTYRDLDAASDALAVGLLDAGFAAGDRMGLYVQNDPAFVIGLLGAWKAGGAAVAINPMNKAGELTYLLADSGATALLCLDELYETVARDVIAAGETRVQTVVTCSGLDHQTRADPRLFEGTVKSRPEGTLDLGDLLETHAGQQPPPVSLSGDDIGVLTYTSGTTGRPKGAMNTHSSMTFNAYTYREWMRLGPEDSVLGVAPLFHITGLIGHVAIAMLVGCPLVLAHRFQPDVVLEAIREHRPTFTVGAIAVFIALGNATGASREDFTSLRAVYSGGAPIAPAVTDRLEEELGVYVHNIYGLTETNSPSHGVPMGVRAPVDENSGALSVGVPVYDTVVRVLGEDGEELPVGEVGEFATSGPQVVPGYWERPDATAEQIPGGELRTGDVGFMDAQGWFFLVDRKKDMINAAGYKVWPREVEDVLYGHPAVREVAVVGIPDEVRGETVKAYVSPKPGATIDPEEVIAWSRERMAAYKYPRYVEVVDELPKTTTGKILRRELRARN